MNRKNKAVSEVIGMLLLLGISISLFSVIYLSILTIFPSSPAPAVDFICSLENDNITLEHRGGKSLDLNTKFIVSIDSTDTRFIAGDYLNIESKDNGVWNIGEKVVYPVGDVTNKNVTLTVVDLDSNSIIVRLVFHE